MSEQTDLDIAVEINKEFLKNHPELPRIPEVLNIIADYVVDRQLTLSVSNLEFALKATRGEVEKAIAAIPADEWKEKVILPEFKKRQKAPPRRQSGKPWGVSTTEWIHSR